MTLSEARQQFIDFLKSKNRSSATILAYGKDIEQLVDFLSQADISEPGNVTTDNLRSFMNKLAKENYLLKITAQLQMILLMH
jgi:site-specific recombinase XerD